MAAGCCRWLQGGLAMKTLATAQIARWWHTEARPRFCRLLPTAAGRPPLVPAGWPAQRVGTNATGVSTGREVWRVVSAVAGLPCSGEVGRVGTVVMGVGVGVSRHTRASSRARVVLCSCMMKHPLAHRVFTRPCAVAAQSFDLCARHLEHRQGTLVIQGVWGPWASGAPIGTQKAAETSCLSESGRLPAMASPHSSSLARAALCPGPGPPDPPLLPNRRLRVRARTATVHFPAVHDQMLFWEAQEQKQTASLASLRSR